MHLSVNHPVSLADSKIEVSVSGLPPKGDVALRASMRLPWAPDVLFESSASFIADENGRADLSKLAPVSGDYQDADSMGLITSMRYVSGDLNTAGENISVDTSLIIGLAAECGTETADIEIERVFLSPDIKTERILDPFYGMFYYSENPDNKTVLMLGGSSGKLSNVLPVASLLASHGFNVLAVAYFSEPGLPKELVDIPLEYFDRVFDWLAANPYTKEKELYLHCTSKGGELGLLLASEHPVIKKVAAFAPHAYCFQGISFIRRASSWTYNHQRLPYIRLPFSTLYGNMLGCFIRNRPFGYTHTHVIGLKRARNKEEARIRVENANADLLLFSGEQCNMWNTFDGCVEIMDRLEQAGYPHEYRHISYENAGEPFYAPYIIPESIRLSMKIAPRFTFTMGGTLQGNAGAVLDSWERMLQFFGSDR